MPPRSRSILRSRNKRYTIGSNHQKVIISLFIFFKILSHTRTFLSFETELSRYLSDKWILKKDGQAAHVK